MIDANLVKSGAPDLGFLPNLAWGGGRGIPIAAWKQDGGLAVSLETQCFCGSLEQLQRLMEKTNQVERTIAGEPTNTPNHDLRVQIVAEFKRQLGMGVQARKNERDLRNTQMQLQQANTTIAAHRQQTVTLLAQMLVTMNAAQLAPNDAVFSLIPDDSDITMTEVETAAAALMVDVPVNAAT